MKYTALSARFEIGSQLFRIEIILAEQIMAAYEHGNTRTILSHQVRIAVDIHLGNDKPPARLQRLQLFPERFAQVTTLPDIECQLRVQSFGILIARKIGLLPR